MNYIRRLAVFTIYGTRQSTGFFTSAFEYTHLEYVLGRYEIAYQKLYKIVHELEAEQIRQKVGMTRAAQMSDADKKRARRDIYTKIKSGSEITFAKTLGVVSATEVIEFARQEGLFDDCKVCAHKNVLHIDLTAMERREKGNEIAGYVEACRTEGCNCGLFTS
jgi:hypothetical protein